MALGPVDKIIGDGYNACQYAHTRGRAGDIEMLRIRLRRVGANKQPSYRIVVADSRAPRDGRFVQQVGHYNPRTDPPTAVLDEEKVLKWLRHGAQPSEAVERILKRQGTLEKAREV